MSAPKTDQLLDPFGAFALAYGFQKAVTDIALENARRGLAWQTKVFNSAFPLIWDAGPSSAAEKPKAKATAKPKAAPKPKKAAPVAKVAAPKIAKDPAPVAPVVVEPAPKVAAPKPAPKPTRGDVSLAPTPDWAPVEKAVEVPAPKPVAKKATPKAKASAKPDDLTALKGVGPKIAKELEGLGVTTFAQIAAWSAKDVESFEAKLSGVPGRITRDGWIDQAKALSKP